MMAVRERNNRLLKWADRFIGIPLVILLGIWRLLFRNKKPGQLNKIGLLRTAAIGDTVILSAIVQDIIKYKNDIDIILFTGSSNFDIALLIPGIKEVVKIPVTNPIKSIQLIRSFGKFDVWIDFGQWPRLDALISFFSQSSFKIGFKTRNQFRHYGYDRAVLHSNEVHEIDNFRNLIKILDIPAGSDYKLNVQNQPKDERLIFIHCYAGGSRSYLKELPDEKWVELITGLIRNNYHIALSGGPADYERLYQLFKKCSVKAGVEILAGRKSLKETAEKLISAAVVISVDTGIMHIADALGVNLIALHGPTNPKRWGPRGNNSHVIQKNICKSCISLGFESKCRNPDCMKKIEVQEIVNALKKFGITL